MSEFRVRLLAYWTASTGEVTELDADKMDGLETVTGEDESDE